MSSNSRPNEAETAFAKGYQALLISPMDEAAASVFGHVRVIFYGRPGRENEILRMNVRDGLYRVERSSTCSTEDFQDVAAAYARAMAFVAAAGLSPKKA